MNPGLRRVVTERQGVHVPGGHTDRIEEDPLWDGHALVVIGVVVVDDAVDPVAVARRRVLVRTLPEVSCSHRVGECRTGERHLAQIPRPWRQVDAHLVGSADAVQLIVVREAPTAPRDHRIPAGREGSVAFHDSAVGPNHGDVIANERSETATANDDGVAGLVVRFVRRNRLSAGAPDAEQQQRRTDGKRPGPRGSPHDDEYSFHENVPLSIFLRTVSIIFLPQAPIPTGTWRAGRKRRPQLLVSDCHASPLLVAREPACSEPSGFG